MPIDSPPKLRRYRRNRSGFVTAVQLRLDTDGLRYRKWGARQLAKPGDWLVDNAGDVYTVDARSFRRSYSQLRPGVYLKTTPVWACVAGHAGTMQTKEGRTRYRQGDYLVFNDRQRKDGYAMTPTKFRALYSRAKPR